MKKRKKTAQELLAELQADRDFVREREQRERELSAVEGELREAERPLLEALRRVGVPVESVWDLVNSSEAYPRALPALVEHLQRPYPERIREGIARALAVPDLPEYAVAVLFDEFERDGDVLGRGVKWGIGCALAAGTSARHLPRLLQLARATMHGQNRAVIVESLGRFDPAATRTTLEELIRDPQVGSEAQEVLKGRGDYPTRV